MNSFKLSLINALGWRTDRKILVFESDDWGTIRMPSRQALKRLKDKGYPIERCPYSRNDSLESDSDLRGLLEVLDNFQSCSRQKPIFTLNNIVANPDFDQIQDSDYQEYFFEPFISTLQKYEHTENVMNLYLEGLSQGLFSIQFHGREHVNVRRWLKLLQNGNSIFRDAFAEKTFTVATDASLKSGIDVLDSFGDPDKSNYDHYAKIVESGLQIFRNIWERQSISFIAPCYVWPSWMNQILREHGIRFLQGTHVQRIPLAGESGLFQKKYHYLGEKNRYGQRYLIRNVSFEPGAVGEKVVDNAINAISIAFRFNKPAIVSSHRFNYIGRIDPHNRDRSLSLLSLLLKRVLNKWPEIEFMSTDDLVGIIGESDRK